MHNEKRRLGESILTRQIEGMRSREKQRETFQTILNYWMEFNEVLSFCITNGNIQLNLSYILVNFGLSDNLCVRAPRPHPNLDLIFSCMMSERDCPFSSLGSVFIYLSQAYVSNVDAATDILCGADLQLVARRSPFSPSIFWNDLRGNTCDRSKKHYKEKIVKKQILLKMKTERKLWITMIAYVLKVHDTQKRGSCVTACVRV